MFSSISISVSGSASIDQSYNAAEAREFPAGWAIPRTPAIPVGGFHGQGECSGLICSWVPRGEAAWIPALRSRRAVALAQRVAPAGMTGEEKRR